MTARYLDPVRKNEYQEKVWAIVCRIPVGRVMTYGQIAENIAPPGEMNLGSYLAFGARWVGAAMAACPDDVPWHRVINAKGMVSQRSEADHQRLRLVEEGIEFDERGRIDLSRYRWTMP